MITSYCAAVAWKMNEKGMLVYVFWWINRRSKILKEHLGKTVRIGRKKQSEKTNHRWLNWWEWMWYCQYFSYCQKDTSFNGRTYIFRTLTSRDGVGVEKGEVDFSWWMNVPYRINIWRKFHHRKDHYDSHIYVHQEPKNKAGRIHRCLSDMDVFLGAI